VHPQPTGLYAELLRRAASQGEINYWVNVLNSGVTPEGVTVGIAASNEYFTQDAGSTDPTFLDQLYLDLLGRPADSGGFNSFLNQLSGAETLARDIIAEALDHSPEYYTNLIISDYQKYLSRSPSAAEINGWLVRFIQGSLTDEALIATLLASPEYFNGPTKGGGTNQGWITSVYGDIFSRAPDPSAQTAVLAQLNAGFPLFNMAMFLLSSPEYRNNLVTGYYTKFLGRLPGNGETNIFLNALAAGATDQNVISFFIGSGEYYNRQKGTATTQAQFDYNWIASAYQQVLPRPSAPPQAEVQGFLDSLNTAEANARASVVNTFVSSDEYRRELITKTYQTYLHRNPSGSEYNLWLPLLRQGSSGPGTASPDEVFVSNVVGSGEYFMLQHDPVTGLETNQQWAISVYNNVLGRQADPAGLNATLSAVLNGYAPQRAAEASALITSGEYRLTFAANLIKQFLRRSPQPGEVNNLVQQLAGGVSDEQLINNLVSSAEYFQNPVLGGSQNSTWLNQVYLDLLGRGTRNDSGAQGFLQALNTGQMTRAQVASVLLTSGEYRTRLINGFYSKYLGRTATQGEVNIWINNLNGGVTDEQVVVSLITSSEYILRQLTPSRLPIIFP
jgi:hypothetical protein